MTTVIGIDGGLDGGITLLIHSGPRNLPPGVELAPDWAPFSYVMPTIGEGRRQYDLQRMFEILSTSSACHVFLERAQPMRGGKRNGDEGARGGTLAAFSQGGGFMAWQAFFVALRMPYEIVSAVTWQKAMHTGVTAGDTKAKTELVCKRLWPTVDWRKNERCRTFHDGKGDSACIAEWGRRQLAQRWQVV